METKSYIQTILGSISPKDAGLTLTHEHLSLTFDSMFIPPRGVGSGLKDAPFALHNLGWIRQNPYSHVPNLVFDDLETHEAIVDELRNFKSSGGGTIVENTTHGLRRDLQFMKEVSLKTGVNIVAGTGFYVAATQTTDTLSKTVEELLNLMHGDLITGYKETGIRCGIIGEIGCSWPLHEFEKKVLKAAAYVQKDLVCPVMIHPGRNEKAPFEIMRLFLEAGGNAEKTVMAHIDRTISDDVLCEFAKLGTLCEFDLFGIETSHYQFNEAVDMPSDAQRIQQIRMLVQEGCEDKIVLSHDIHTKHRLTRFGGHGFSHIIHNVIPKMKNRGLSQETIEKFLVANPRNWLTVHQDCV